MMDNIYVTIRGEEHIVSGDFAQAASPLCIDGDSTPHQVADARHRREIAVAICLAHIGAAHLPTCPTGMTPDVWKAKVSSGDYPDWGDVSYRTATDEDVSRVAAID